MRSRRKTMPRLTSPVVIKEVLKRHGFTMSKGLGQNFLIDANIVEKIVDTAEVTKEDTVLEIGPGIGSLTERLCERAKEVISVEIDDRLIPILKETVGQFENFTLIHQDILKTDLKELFEKRGVEEVKVVANLPYYITTPIVMGLLEKNLPIASITVMVQKEVAQRMCAAPGGKDYGALTVACGYYTEASYDFTV
ncbi:MAG TPA: ribosomal RNA small subunit methyltransferase A, partial [Eubacteriaceae bacterium]|nr:ribosomal RNA small subunit methyltransferase A [Eubacteriaceae bacterium]